MSENVAGESPIACNLNALDKEQRRRYQSLTAQLRAAVQETRELPDGYSFRLPSLEARSVAIHTGSALTAAGFVRCKPG